MKREGDKEKDVTGAEGGDGREQRMIKQRNKKAKV